MGFTTRESLLARINAGDEMGWREFAKTYAPLIRIRGKGHNLRGHELDDLLQDVLLSMLNSSKTFKYDKTKGRFQHFLRSVIDHKAFDILRKRRDGKILSGTEGEEVVNAMPADDSMELTWEAEWRIHVLNLAMTQLRLEVAHDTYQAFDFYAIKGKSAESVAKFLGMTKGNVYLAKNRVLERLRNLIMEMPTE